MLLFRAAVRLSNLSDEAAASEDAEEDEEARFLNVGEIMD